LNNFDQRDKWRTVVKNNLPRIVERMNLYLNGENLNTLKKTITRLGRGGILPEWYNLLNKDGSLPNADGKTVGSILEMLFCADVEINVLKNESCIPLKINPAKGVDIPGLDIGIKSPSENWCTSEPFTSAYERILGTDYDVIAVITNYQTAKKSNPMSLNIIKHAYFNASEIADKNLCEKAIVLKECFEELGEANIKKGVRFLAHVIQSNWFGSSLAKIFVNLNNDKKLRDDIKKIVDKAKKKLKNGDNNIQSDDVSSINDLLSKKPIKEAFINLCDSWVNEHSSELAIIPNSYYWNKFMTSPLDGKLGVSFALQWRYNFGVFFRG